MMCLNEKELQKYNFLLVSSIALNQETPIWKLKIQPSTTDWKTKPAIEANKGFKLQT